MKLPATFEEEPPGRDAVIFLLDAASIFGHRISVMKAVCNAVLSELRNGQRKMDFGLMFSPFDRPALPEVVMEVHTPDPEDLDQLVKITEHGGVSCVLGPDNGLAAALEVVSLEFGRMREAALRRLVIVTQNDQPYVEIRHASTLMARLVTKESVLVQPVFLGPHFAVNRFWSWMQYTPISMQESYRSTAIASDLSMILKPIDITRVRQAEFDQIMRSKASRKLVSFRALLYVGTIAINTSCYRITREARPRLITVAQGDADVTQEAVPDDEPAVEGDKIALSREQLDATSLFDSERTFTLDRFVHLCTIPTYARYGHSYMVVASNKRAPGSKLAFAALHRAMRRRAVAACVTLRTRRAPVRGYLYASSPCGLDPEPSTLSGMYFVPVASLDDSRELQPRAAATPHLPMESLISKFALDSYDPQGFISAQHAQHVTVLEQVALGRKVKPCEMPDPTPPFYEGIEFVRPECDEIRHRLGL